MLTNGIKNRILAIDYGTKRIGIAISDPLCLFPSIMKTIPNDKNIFSKFSEIIINNNIERIIMGIPAHSNGKTIILAEEIIKFKEELEKRTNLKIQIWDERFTSKIAEERILRSVVKKSKRRNKSLIDAYSAAIILEEFLKNNSKN